ncbi:MAG TPA: ATP-binding protein, partial [Armatimonadota bacterium]|nr:ATP-binding protein [Armatimonadota bacterium]
RVFETRAAESLADLSRAAPESNPSYWSYAVWPLLDQEGVATQVADTTEHRRAAEAHQGDLRRVNQQLLIAALREDERAEKLQLAVRAKDEFVAMLAHELRNPLAAVRSGIYVLDQRADPQDTHTHETCALLERQMRHLSRLLDDLLDVSRMTRGKIDLRLEPVDVAQILRDAVAASRSLLELKRHELTLAVPPEPVWVEADPVRLEQVVTNLFQNAIKYMDPGGHVWLSLEQVPDETGAGKAPGAAVIRVRDLGIGISPEALPHIFDLFVQADPSHERGKGGLGIGLTLVKSLVELHGGSVEASSEGLGRGSEFRVLLSLGTPPLGAAAGSEEPAAAPSAVAGGSRDILLVEDNLAAAATLAEVLELWGYRVRIACNGDVALAAAAVRPDVVVLDIGLPGMDGYEVARRMREELGLHETLLVALTGYGQEADRQRSRESGFDHHLIKPVDLDELRRIIDARQVSPEAPSQVKIAAGSP